MRTWIASAIVTMSLLGCEAVGAQPRSRESASSERMGHHFEQATRARDALVRADLSAARRAARELAEADAPPALHRTPVEAMRGAARRVASSGDLRAASREFGSVARACGGCHDASGAEVSMPEVPLPAGDDLRDRMRRHFWATDRLWEGLVIPDQRRFAAGATELLDAPLFASTPATGQTVAPEARALADAVRARAREARSAADGGARARAYGELLSTCGDCHRLVGVAGPAAPVAL